MVRWYEPVSTQGQDLLGGQGGANRVQVRRCAPDCGPPGISPRRGRVGGPARGLPTWGWGTPLVVIGLLSRWVWRV